MSAWVMGAQKGLQPAREPALITLLRKLDISSNCKRYPTCRLIGLLASESKKAQCTAV